MLFFLWPNGVRAKTISAATQDSVQQVLSDRQDT